MKKCGKCNVDYQPSESDLKKQDYMCVPCRRQYYKEYRAKRKAEGNPVIGGKMSKESYAEYCKTYYQKPEVKKRRAEISKEIYYSPAHAEKINARRLFRNAYRRKEIIKGNCEVCGAERVDAHHDDYSKPLDIRWLCRTHHAEHHAKHKEQA